MTRILALETSLRGGSVALALEGRIVAEKSLPQEMRSAQSLAPTVKELLAAQGWRPSQVDAVGVTIGPGSFTGVRIGVTFAKVFCYAAGSGLIGLTTLEVLAHQAPGVQGELHVVLDAQRSDLFQQAFQVQRGVAAPLGAPQVIAASSWIAGLAGQGDFAVSGPGLAKHRAALPGGIHVVAEPHWEPSASVLALQTHRAWTGGRRDDVWKLAPLYLRASAAEEKRAAYD